MLEYKLLPVDETVPEDPAAAALAAAFKEKVDRTYLSEYGLTFDQVIAHSPFDFTPVDQFGQEQGEDGLGNGNLIADSYLFAVKEAEGTDYVPVDFAVVASGVVRASLAEGPITVSDAFRVSSLGSGGDGTPGYPLISVYITGRELKEWYALAAYLRSMGTADPRYAAPDGRKLSAPSWNPVQLLKNPNRITLAVLAGVLAVLLLAVRLIRRAAGGGGRRRGRGRYQPYRGR